MSKCASLSVLPGGSEKVDVKVDDAKQTASHFVIELALTEHFNDPCFLLEKLIPGIHALHPINLMLKEALRQLKEKEDLSPVFVSKIKLPASVQTSKSACKIKTANAKSGDRKCMQAICVEFHEADDIHTKQDEQTNFSF